MASTSLECSIPRPDIGELHDAISTEFSKRLLGGAPVLPLSSEDVLAFVMAGTTNLMWGFITQTLKEQDPAHACCDNLVILAARRGLNLQGSTRAKGYVAVTGNPGTPIPSMIRFVGASSREYKLDLGATFNPNVISPSGGAVLRIVSILPGGVFNATAGQSLTVSATLPGVDGVATVIGNGLTGGADPEDCETLRARLLEAEASDIVVPNEAWYIRETMLYPGVTRACTDQCIGCCDPTYIGIYPFMEGVYGDVDEAPYGAPPCDVLEEMTDWMFGKENGRGQGKAPVGIRGEYLPALPTYLNVTARCFSGCPSGAEDRIRTALVEYVRATTCVGSMICKDQLRAAVYRSLGPDPCMSDIQLNFDSSIRFEDWANAYLDCGHMLVIGGVSLI